MPKLPRSVFGKKGSRRLVHSKTRQANLEGKYVADDAVGMITKAYHVVSDTLDELISQLAMGVENSIFLSRRMKEPVKRKRKSKKYDWKRTERIRHVSDNDYDHTYSQKSGWYEDVKSMSAEMAEIMEKILLVR
jgi:hypothetical protein